MVDIQSVACTTHPSDENQTGQVLSGSLVLEGRVKDFKGIHLRAPYGGGVRTDLFGDWPENWPAVKTYLDEPAGPVIDFTLLPFFTTTDTSARARIGARTVWGLLLSPEPGGTWRRIGAFEFDDHRIPGGHTDTPHYPFADWDKQKVVIR